MSAIAPDLGPGAERDLYTVSRLNREARVALESGLGVVWVEGEVSNLSRPASGHLYFSLKDEQAQVRCAMFRMRNQHLAFEPRNGLHVLARARVSLYEPRGDFQLLVDYMEPAGEGALRLAYEKLKHKLAAEGLFEQERKRPLPRSPAAIGVISSGTGAALRDILSVLRRRCPWIPVVVYPVPVQGAAAAPAIVRALEVAGQRAECDVLLLARGGGSLEDLWAFNEEAVARAIAACPLPVVSGVGHEVDFTIADFVADVRAPTPSAAAELVGPDAVQLREHVLALRRRLRLATQGRLRASLERLATLRRRLVHPGRRLQQLAQRLDELTQRRDRAVTVLVHRLGARLATLQARLRAHHPAQRLHRVGERRAQLERRLVAAVTDALRRSRQRLALAGRALHAVSPLATLDRGYAIVSRAHDGAILREASAVQVGDQVHARLAHGHLECRVERLWPGEAAGPEARPGDTGR